MKYEKPWNGVPLSGPVIAFDTETTIVDLQREIPDLCVLSASDGERTVLVGPNEVAAFVQEHWNLQWVGWNTAFDWWVVYNHLGPRWTGWVDLLDEGGLHDGMLLEQLLRLAEGRDDEPFLAWGLKKAADHYCGIELDKDSGVRSTFAPGQFYDYDLDGDPRWEYAARDAFATFNVWSVVHARAVQASQRIPGGVRPIPGMAERLGLLTESLQTRSAVALMGVTRNGFAINRDEAERKLGEGRERVKVQVDRLRKTWPSLVKVDRKGNVKLTPGSGVPQTNVKELQRLLTEVAVEKQLSPPVTEKTKVVTTSSDWWSENAFDHPLVETWVGIQEEAKTLQLLSNVQGCDSVHPSYNPLVRTGRVSARDPNIQQIPRESWFRSLFVSRPGTLLVTLDFSAIELRTLAAILESRFGSSALALTLRAGKCPHTNTASIVLGESYELVGAKIKAEKKLPENASRPYSKARQSAKAINFGVPGGLGATKLAAYAKRSYGVDMSLDEARVLRDKLITEVYPELTTWLQDDIAARLGWSLGCTRATVERVFGELQKWGDPADSPVARVVAGRMYRKDGVAFSPFFVDQIWVGLESLIGPRTSPEVAKAIRNQRSGPDLHQQLFQIPSVTLTGRSRLKTFYGDFRNTQFQGLAADGAKVALWELQKRTLERGDFKTVAFIHDEVVVEVPAGQDGGQSAGKEVEEICVKAFATVLPNDFPVACEWGVGPVWAKG